MIAGDDVTAAVGGATFDNKNVGDEKTVTASLTLGGADQGNYTVNANATDLADITPLALMANITANDKVYDGTAAATLTGGANLTGVIAGDDVTATAGSATFSDKNVGDEKTVTASLTLGGADQANYAVNATATDLADITPLALTASITANDKAYDGTNAATLTGGANLTGVIAGDDVTASVGAATFGDKNVGDEKTVTANLTLSGADQGNYSFSGSATDLADITPLALTASITANDKVYDGTNAATLTGGANLTGVIAGDDVTAAVGGATFDNKNVGDEKTVTASLTLGGADQANYTVNASATDLADITPLALTASITANDKVYDGTTAATLTGGANLAGVIAGDDVTAAVGSATFGDKNVGDEKTVTASLTLSGADQANYTVNANATDLADITPLALTASITANDKVYDGTAAAQLTGGANLSGVIAGDDVTATVGAATFGDKNVGDEKTVTASLTLSGADQANYTVNANATDLADITPLALTASITANDKVYDGTNAATLTGGANLTGVIAGDDVTASVGAATFGDKNVGDEKTVTASLTLGGADQANYTVNASATDLADITPLALTASITANDKVYDGTTAATLTGGANLAGVIAGDDVTAAVGTATFGDKNVGDEKTVTASLTLSGADQANYTVNASAAALADITPLALTASITANDKVYDGTTAATLAGGASLTGIIAGDDVTATVGGADFADKNVGDEKTVSASVTLGGGDQGNYTVNATATDLADITPLALTVSITANDKVYDGTTAATITDATLAGVIAGDDVAVSASNGQFDTAAAGNGKTVTADVELAGYDAVNYALAAATATTTANITKRPLTVTADDRSKTYGEALLLGNTAFSVAGTFVDGDSLATVTLTSAGAAANAPVGTGTYPITASDALGVGLSNYAMEYLDGTLTVNKKQVVIELPPVDEPYDGTPKNTSCTITDGLAGTLSYVGVNSTVYGPTAVAPTAAGDYEVTCSTPEDPNYEGPFTKTTTVKVGKLPLSVTADNRSKTFGDELTLGTTAFTVSGTVIAGDAVNAVTLTSAGAAANAPVGTGSYPITPSAATGTGLANYTISYLDGTLTVNKKQVVIELPPVDEPYDGTPKDTSCTITDGLAGTLSYVGVNGTVYGPSASAPVNAGDYEVTCSTPEDPNYEGPFTKTTTVKVDKLPLSVTANDRSKIYGEALTLGTTAFSVSGTLVSGDSVDAATLTSAGAAANAPVGTGSYPIAPSAATGTGLANYTISYLDGTLTVNKKQVVIELPPVDEPYDGTPKNTSCSITDGLAGTLSYVGINGTVYGPSADAPVNAGDYEVTCSTPEDPNYEGPFTKTTTVKVGKLALTVTADDRSKTYGEALTLGTTLFSVSGTVIAGDGINAVTLTSAGAAANAPVGTGSYPITPSAATGTGLSNYTIEYLDGTLTVSRKPLEIELPPVDEPYDKTPKDAVCTITDGLTGTLSYVGVNGTVYGPSADAPVNAGDYEVTCSVPEDPNYDGPFTKKTTVKVQKIAITVTADPKSKYYGDADPVLTYQVTSGSLVGDDSLTGELSRLPGTNIGTFPIGQNTLSAGDNYVLTYQGANLTILARPVTVTAGGGSKVYGTPDPGPIAVTSTGFLPAELGGLTFSATRAPGDDAGPYATTATVVGDGLGNYAISYVPGTFVIEKAAPVVQVLGGEFEYDGEPHAAACVVNGPLGPLPGTITYTPGPGVPVNEGTYTATCTFPGDGNHTAASATALVIITPPICSIEGPGAGAVVRKQAIFNGQSETVGSVQVLTGSNVIINGGAEIVGDLFIAGTPKVRLHGVPTTYAGTVDGDGAATPNHHYVTIGGGAELGRVVRRTDPIAMPVVSAPPLPSGTRSVNMNKASDNPGSFATIRNLTLNGNVGNVAVPPGTYGTFTANARSSFTVGIPGATEPAIYNFQALTLNGQSGLKVVGPVVITVKTQVNFNAYAGTSAHPEWLTLRIATGGIHLNGQADFWGYVEAPNGPVIINGQTTFTGGLKADTLTINGNGKLNVKPANSCEPVNVAPIAVNDSYTTTKGQSLTVSGDGVLLNDTDEDNDNLTVELVAAPSSGTVTLNAGGSFTYAPAANFTGTVTFTYKVKDENGAYSAPATVTITVTAPPVAVDDSYSTPKSVTLNVAAPGVIGNDSDPAGTQLVAELVSGPSNGTLTLNGDGSFSYKPSKYWYGTDTFTYKVKNADGVSSNVATVTVKVTKPNVAPDADNDHYSTKKNTKLTVAAPGVLKNDSDPGGGALTAQLVSNVAKGTLALNANGSFTYTPARNWVGTVTFTYKAKDADGLWSAPATVTIVVHTHYDGDNCDHDRNKRGHYDGDGDEHDRNSHKYDRDDRDDDHSSHHRDGDGDDHDRRRNGHYDGDGDEHDRNSHKYDRDDRDDDHSSHHRDGDGDDHDRRRNGHYNGDGCEHDRQFGRDNDDDRDGRGWRG
ncbi:MAG: YDG domain-containing protein [Vicinamibacterales bacterium]